jgi:hypothetical protein
VLRIDVETGDASHRIPPSNPSTASPGHRPEICTYASIIDRLSREPTTIPVQGAR